MADFDKAIGFVLRDEDATLSGKLTKDSGGRTRFGIAERFHPGLGDAFYEAPAAEALERAKAIYRQEYWPQVAGDYIESDAIAAKLLDMAVNMGKHEAKVLLQRSLNATGRTLAVDGCLGEKTLESVNGADVGKLLAEMCVFQEQFYRHLVSVIPGDSKYLDGWVVRAKHIPQFAAAAAAAPIHEFLK